MSFSKPIKRTVFNLSTCYLESLYLNPVRTKCLTSCLIASLGNYVAQKISGLQRVELNSVFAFGIFGLVFGGTIPHFFYRFLEQCVPGSVKYSLLIKVLVERFLYAPFYQFFSLYTLARLEGKEHEKALLQAHKLFWTVLQANWRWLSLVQFLNLSLIPPELRVLVVNVIGFFWSIFLATKRRQSEFSK